MSESGGVKEYSFNEPVQLQEWYDVGADIRVNLRKQFGALTKELNKLQSENQGLRESLDKLVNALDDWYGKEHPRGSYFDWCHWNEIKDKALQGGDKRMSDFMEDALALKRIQDWQNKHK